MTYDTWSSLTEMFFDKASRLGDKPFLWAKTDGAYRPWSWRRTDASVRALARGLLSLGVARGDRVVLVAENRPEWVIADLATMAAGAITVPAYVTNTTGDHEHILTHSGASGAIVSTRALAERLVPAAVKAPDCKWLVAMEDLAMAPDRGLDVIAWSDLLARGGERQDDLDALTADIERDEVACFIYTSGTGGVPKGVMLSHGNILCNCMGAYHLLESFGLGDEVFLSFLPLSHAYEHTAGMHFPISIGAEIYYAEGAEHLLKNLGEARPTIMTAVPRLYESMHQRIRRGIDKQGGLKKILFDKALDLGLKRYREPHGLGLGERLTDGLVERLVRDKIRERFGGRLKAMVSGGAALNPEIGLFFTALGVPILQGYGQTESAPVVSANLPGKVKMHTVGPPFRGVEVEIAEDGEILVRGELVMRGYWRDEEATAAAVRDGWLHTGDIGRIDEDGYLRITDRKKDIIVLSGGDNVSPARIEGLLTLEPEIAQAMVFGDKRPYLVALLVPDTEFIAEWARANGKEAKLESLSEDTDFKAALDGVLERVNAKLAALERVRRLAVAREAFTVENGMMTPTLKIRRHAIKANHGEALTALYGDR